jgi:hypothetical protein
MIEGGVSRRLSACQNLPKERYVERLHLRSAGQPEAINDPLTEAAREGPRRMLAQVLIAEADSFVAGMERLEIAGWPRPHRASWPWAGIAAFVSDTAD